jgi:predicted amidohydrolase YtcJ
MYLATAVTKSSIFRTAAFILALGVVGIGACRAQTPETILLNAKVIRYDAAPAEAVAVRDGRIAAIGSSADIQRLAGPQTRVIDVGGRTVIPGLIDSHIHAIRAGLTFDTEVHWIGIRTLAEALDRIRAAAKQLPEDAWIVVAGGWTERQFAEDRLPTQAEIAAAAPGHHVYVQLLYSRVLLDPGGYDALGIAADPDLAAGISIERDGAGQPTGWLTGDNRAISRLFDLLPHPTMGQKVAGTRGFFRELNATGLTGVIDPGGYNLSIADYQPLFQIWRAHALSLRVGFSLCAPRSGHELEDFQDLTQVLPMGFGDDWLRFNGIGENVTFGMYNNEAPTEAQKDELYRVLRWAAAQGLSATFHWNNERSVHHLLEVLERVDAEAPIARLRWSIAHLNDASPDSLTRMRRLGLGWLMQNAFYFRGEAFLGQRGPDAARVSPPIVSALDMGLSVGGGTDAHRVMWFSPFVSLQWMLDGKTIGGMATRGSEQRPSRMQALRLYTQGSAWFVFDEARRGAIAVDQFADLAVLSQDYFSIPTEEIGSITSLLTMVGGRIVFASGPFAKLEDRAPGD